MEQANLLFINQTKSLIREEEISTWIIKTSSTELIINTIKTDYDPTSLSIFSTLIKLDVKKFAILVFKR